VRARKLEFSARWLGLLAAGCLAFTAGCTSRAAPKDYTPVVARFFLEAGAGDGVPLTLPQSGVKVTVNPKPVIAEGDIGNVELVRVDLGECLLFQLAPSALRDFYRLTVTHQGRRLVLMLDGQAVGARRIDGPITNGALFVFVERPDTELPALVQNLKKSSAAIQQELARKG